jgi:hypothetical protein
MRKQKKTVITEIEAGKCDILLNIFKYEVQISFRYPQMLVISGH